MQFLKVIITFLALIGLIILSTFMFIGRSHIVREYRYTPYVRIERLFNIDTEALENLRDNIGNMDREEIGIIPGVPNINFNNQNIFGGMFGEIQEPTWMFDETGMVIGMNGERFMDQLVRFAENNGIMDTRENDDGTIQTDNQNVHDSGVQSSVRKSVDNLRNVVNVKMIGTLPSVLSEIKRLEIPESIKKKSISSLKFIDRVNINIMNLNMREKEVLDLVWSRIEEIEDLEKKKNLKVSLAYQLSDIFKGDIEDVKNIQDSTNYECATGRVNRIINSLNGIDDSSIVNIRPKWALKRDMTQKSPIIIKSLSDRIMQERNISKEEFENSEDYSKLVNEELIKVFTEEYKDLVKSDDIKKIVISWNL